MLWTAAVEMSVVLGLVATPAAVTLNQVRHLRVIDQTDTTVTLKWKDQAAAQHYQIRVLKNNGDRLKTVTTTAHRKTIKGLSSDTRYGFKVRAVRHAHVGAYSTTLKTRTNPATTPVLVGFWGLNGYISADGLADVQDRFHSTVFQVAESPVPYTFDTFLPLVKTSGLKVALRLTGDHSTYTTDGNFDLTKWKTALGTWAGSDLQAYIDDGTVVGHMLIDDVNTFSGTDPTAADLEEMARTSKEVLPGLMTYVRQKCSNVPIPVTGTYQYLDDCDNQYTNYPGYSDGSITDYVTEQTAAAEQLGLGMINGLNIADGGDGSSGQPGASSGKYAMSAEEITTYGEALLAVPNIQLFLMWEYDGEQLWSDGTIGSDYFDQPALQAAIASLP